jgi:RimJ/RimL family protein N-acetyltransferase
MKAGLLHSFTILRSSDRLPIGSIGIAPNQQNASGDIGLWIGLPFQGRGYGTKAIALIAAFGFEKLGLERLEARVFVGNAASRRIFENNLFSLEGTLRHAVLKRGKFLDEWIFGLLRENYFSAKGPK